MLTLSAFIANVPKAAGIAAAYLGINTMLSFIKGYTLTAAVGGADMRAFISLLPHP